VGFR
jgi:predicted nucleic acid-binding protein